MEKEELYSGREQTLVKHFILQRYLERFAHIVGSHWDALTYIDCFSGPWNVRSDSFEDCSFGIALRELRKARDTHQGLGRRLRLRAFFLEKNAAAYSALNGFAHGIRDAEIRTKNATLEDSVADLVAFARAGGQKAFPFIFIDPTGWTGFAMDTIAPLLRLNPGEVLINFMTGHVRRFLESPLEQTQESFRRLFGTDDFREKVQGLNHQDREDMAVQEYMIHAKAVGGFDYGCSAIVLHPEMDRTHFHLIYLTRNLKGVEVFKDVEKKAMEVQEAARAEAQQRKRVARDGQGELFGGSELRDSNHYESLRDRYLAKARQRLLSQFASSKHLPYDDAWMLALSEPLVWESDLKRWIEEWKNDGKLEVGGMQPRQRVPHRNEGNFLIWR